MTDVPVSSAHKTPDQLPELGDRMRLALRQVAMPLTVVLMQDENEIRGATVTSFMPVSLDPPTLAVGIGKGRWLHEAFASSKRFTINVLAAGQEPLAMHFASSTNRASGVSVVRYATTPDGLPALEESLVVFSCEHNGSLAVGEHTVHIGTVVEVSVDPELEPALWHDGGSAYLAPRRS